MPKYRIQVAVEYSGNEYYEIEADSEAAALELAKLGVREGTEEFTRN